MEAVSAKTLTYDGGDARSVTAMAMPAEYFEVLGLRPTVGRLIGPHNEPALDESHVVVLSHDFWQSAFGGIRPSRHYVVVNGQALTSIRRTKDPARPRVSARLLPTELPLMHGNLRRQ